MTNIKQGLFLFKLKKKKDKTTKALMNKQSSNAYLQLDVGHTGGLVSSPLCFLD